MKKLLMKLLINVGFQLLREHIADDSDTSDIEERLIEANSKKELVAVMKEETIRAIDEYVLEDTEIPDGIVDGLVKASNTEEVVAVLESEAGQQTLFSVIGEVINGIGGLLASIFGKKK